MTTTAHTAAEHIEQLPTDYRWPASVIALHRPQQGLHLVKFMLAEQVMTRSGWPAWATRINTWGIGFRGLASQIAEQRIGAARDDDRTFLEAQLMLAQLRNRDIDTRRTSRWELLSRTAFLTLTPEERKLQLAAYSQQAEDGMRIGAIAEPLAFPYGINPGTNSDLISRLQADGRTVTATYHTLADVLPGEQAPLPELPESTMFYRATHAIGAFVHGYAEAPIGREISMQEQKTARSLHMLESWAHL